MFQYRRLLTIGMVGSIAAALAGCSTDGPTKDDDSALEDAIAAAQTALQMELPGIPGEVEAVGIRNGIPVVQYHAPEDATAPFTGAYGYGGWLGERGFAVYSAPEADVVGDTYILANDQDMSEGAPGAADGFSATWNGVMLGVDTAATDDAGVQGDAELNLHSGMGAATVDVEFSNVAGVNNDREYDGQSWTGISLTGSNFSGTSSDGGDVDGQFYGDQHENVIGDFAYDNLVGAWGAVRMPGAGDADDDVSDDSGGMGDDSGDMGDDSGDMGDDSGDMGDDSGDMGGDDSGDMGGDDSGDMGGDDSGDMGGDDSGDMGGDDSGDMGDDG